MSKDTQTCIGLMSGTSSDAIDAVLVEISDQGRKAQMIATHTEPIESTLREKIRTPLLPLSIVISPSAMTGVLVPWPLSEALKL